MVAPVAASIGDTDIARRLYAGRYADILATTIDSPAAGCHDLDVAFVVGALSFVGRMEEAELSLENHRRSREPSVRTLAAGGFFLTVAHARAGNSERAQRTLIRAYRETMARRDAWSRAFLFQAIACCHYFAARYARAAQSALDAQGSALEARFAYIQMLATDMRAHVLAQRGELDEGLRLLDQARNHARHLGLDVNVRVIETSIALERARVNHPADAITRLEHLLEATDIQDNYSRRLLLCELAKCYALVGRGSEARRAIDESGRLGTSDPRARAALACARTEVTRVIAGWVAAETHLWTARQIAETVVDPPVHAEIAGLSLGCATYTADASKRKEAILALEALLSEHRLYRARSWLYQYGATATATPIDEFALAMRPVVATARNGSDSAEATRAVLRTGLLGLIAEAGGMVPARRIHLFEDCEVLEAEGDVRRLHGLPPRGRAVLLALGKRGMSKEALLAAVWDVVTYRSERHDSLIKTTVSRLRAALGRGQMWIETVEGGYRIADGITVVDHGGPSTKGLADASSIEPTGPTRGAPAPPASQEPRAVRRRELARELGQAHWRSAGELATRVGSSVRTVSRDLTEMHREGLVERMGEGRGTKYRARETPPDPAPVTGADSDGERDNESGTRP
jgi:DNA-binding winged helix-turn-helix (wHTH) protein